MDKEQIKKQLFSMYFEFNKTYNDYPKAASENAKTALRWAEKNGWGSCGTPVGKRRANQLVNGESISRETIARMAAFERHRQNSNKELGDGCGRLMWLAWGGDEGIEWAQRKLKQIDKERFEFKEYIERVRSTNVDKVKWDSETKEMTIKFDDGSIYVYFNVPEKVFDNIVDGQAGSKVGKYPSVGAAVHQYLKGFKYQKVGTF